MREVNRETLLEKIADLELLKESGAISLHGEYNLTAYKMLLATLDVEPVAEVVSIYGDPEAFGEREIKPLVGIQQIPYGTKLYLHNQRTVVPDDVLEALQKVARIRLDLNDFDGDCRGISDCLSDAEEALIEVVNRRAATLNQK